MVDKNGKCFYSNDEEVIGSDLAQKLQEIQNDKERFVVTADGKNTVCQCTSVWMQGSHFPISVICRG